MKVLKKDITPTGIKIQIEDWSEDYSFMKQGSTIGAYPTATKSGNSSFSPERGKAFRLTYNFESNKDAEEVFQALIKGSKTLKGIEDCLHDKKYKDFI